MVLRFAGEFVFGCAVFAKGAHGAAGFIRIFQTIKHHVVINFVVAHAVAASAFQHQIRRIGHAFHATGHHHVLRACAQYVVGKHGGTHA